jgi:hypothetical protein
MLQEKNSVNISKDELAVLGAGQVGYVRRMTSDELVRRFPGAIQLQSGLDLWALFAADGTPIMLSDDARSAYVKAAESELNTVSVH